jgi:hypothetical protein
MPNINTATFTLTDTEESRSLGDRLEDRWISVKEFGATGDGETDDTAAIQAAFDYAYGTEADPHGSSRFGLSQFGGVEVYTNKAVFFPSGNYKVSSTLKLNLATGATLIGCGSHQTRIFYDSEADEHIPTDTATADTLNSRGSNSSLLECRMCWMIEVRGMTLDAGGVQGSAMRAMYWPPEEGESPDGDDGSDGFYYDVHLTNAVYQGFLTYGDEMGSERTWINCKFTNCKWGHRLAQANAVNHNFYNCLFADNWVGLSQTTGGQGMVVGCRFEGSLTFDVAQVQAWMVLIGCSSTSQNFLNAACVAIGCTHDNASEGIFWSRHEYHDAPTIYLPNPYYTEAHGSFNNFVCKGSRSSNGIFHARNSDSYLYSRGSAFANSDYLTDFTGNGATVVQNI